MAKGKLPVTGTIDLDTGPEQWNLFRAGLIALSTKGILKREDTSNVSINIEITAIFSPSDMSHNSRCVTESSLGSEISAASSRISTYMDNLISSSRWTIIGKINGGPPILIFYYEFLGISIYTQKIHSDKDSNFSVANEGGLSMN